MLLMGPNMLILDHLGPNMLILPQNRKKTITEIPGTITEIRGTITEITGTGFLLHFHALA